MHETPYQVIICLAYASGFLNLAREFSKREHIKFSMKELYDIKGYSLLPT
jgi:hypothetical protein